MRTKAREVVFQLTFAKQFDGAGSSLNSLLYKKEKLTPDDINYCDKVLDLIAQHGAEFSEIIDKHSWAFPESRLFPADRSILFVALAEIRYMDDVPAAVSINEAANIASKYSSEKSATFISGILADIIKG